MARLADIAVFALLTVLVILQSSSGFPVNEPAQNDKTPKSEFAKEAADALDSTLLFLKNGFESFIRDSTKLSNMFSNLTDNIIKLAPEGEISHSDDSQIRLHNLAAQTNRTFSGRLFKMDD